MFLSTTTRLLLSLLRPALLRPRFNSDFAPWELRALKQLEVMEAEARAKSLLPKTTRYCDFPLHRLRNEACSRGLGSKGKKSEVSLLDCVFCGEMV